MFRSGKSGVEITCDGRSSKHVTVSFSLHAALSADAKIRLLMITFTFPGFLCEGEVRDESVTLRKYFPFATQYCELMVSASDADDSVYSNRFMFWCAGVDVYISVRHSGQWVGDRSGEDPGFRKFYTQYIARNCFEKG